jgi:hypothetical protein
MKCKFTGQTPILNIIFNQKQVFAAQGKKNPLFGRNNYLCTVSAYGGGFFI